MSLRDAAERRRFLKIITDEAGDEILVSPGAGGGGSLEASIASLRQAEEARCSHVMFGLPAGPGLETEAEVLDYAQQVIDSTDLGIVLYIRRNERFQRSRAGNVLVEVLSRLAELPNVVGAKITPIPPYHRRRGGGMPTRLRYQVKVG